MDSCRVNFHAWNDAHICAAINGISACAPLIVPFELPPNGEAHECGVVELCESPHLADDAANGANNVANMEPYP